VLLLIDEHRRPPEPQPQPQPRRTRLPYRVMPSATTAVALYVVAATDKGATGAFAAMGALIATFRALDRALPYKQGLGEYKQ
jgi:hypothetical protein